jgi:hypothetical protein
MYFNGKKVDDALVDNWFSHLNTNLELLLLDMFPDVMKNKHHLTKAIC